MPRGRPRKEEQTVEEIDPFDAFGTDDVILQDTNPATRDAILDMTPPPPPPQPQVTVLAPQPAPGAAVMHTASDDNGLFGAAVQHEDSIKSVAKQLFTHDVIDLKTDISHNEINNITRLRFLQSKFGVGVMMDNGESDLDHLVNSFLRLRVSKDRKSRAEFIAALQTENRNTQGGNIFSRMFGSGGGQP